MSSNHSSTKLIIFFFVSLSHSFTVFPAVRPQTIRRLAKEPGASVSSSDWASPKKETSPSRNQWVAGWEILLAYLGACLLVSITLCAYEDYDAANLKPSVHLRPYHHGAVRGMGEGLDERLVDLRGGNVLVNPVSDVSLVNIPSYNEVMERHRKARILSWKQPFSDEQVETAVGDIVSALNAVNRLKLMADDYRWDDMRRLIRDPILSTQLELSSSVLRRAATSTAARDEIGFDWGSCAWRHCGAYADAQESLAELYNLVGVLEPFECRFVLDIVERSLRDIFAVVPNYSYHVADYQPYKIREATTDDEGSRLDMEFLEVLEGFKNPQWED